MGVTEQTSSKTEQGNGSTTLFTFDFRVFETSDLKVIVRNNTTNVESVKALGVDYSATLNDDEGGSITMFVAPADGETLYIGSAIPETQPNTITVGNLPASTLEQMYDRLTLLVHQIKELTARVPKFVQSSSSLNKTMEEPVEGEFLAWDASGNIVNQAAAIAPGSIVDGDISPTAAIALSKLEALTANRAVATDASGGVVVSAVTDTELGYVGGVTSAIQTQIDAKASTTDLNNHVSNTSNPHSVTAAQVGLGNVDNTSDATKNSAVATLANKTLTSPVINTSVSGTAILDEDDMVSNSATQLATQQSIKAYVDAQVAAAVGGFTVDTRSSSFTAQVGYVHRIDSSGGAITVTPPAGANGDQIVLEKTTSDFNAITFTGITAIHTLGERVTLIYNGSAWVVFNRYILSEWTSYTPSFTGFGTVSSSQFYWKRIGDSMVVNGIFTAGSTSATTAGISLPSGTSVSTSFITSAFNAGQYTRNVNSSGANKGYVILEDGQTEINLSARGDNNPFTRAAGDACFDTGNSGGVYTTPFKIQGWNG